MPAPSTIRRRQNTKHRQGKRSVTIPAGRRLSVHEVKMGKLLVLPQEGAEWPGNRMECLPGGVNEARPCPWVRCKYHVLLDVDPDNGQLFIRDTPREGEDWPDVLLRMPETCVLDVADKQGATLEEVGTILGITRERARQIEEQSADRIKAAAPEEGELPEPAAKLRTLRKNYRPPSETTFARDRLLGMLAQSKGPWTRSDLLAALGLGVSGSNVIHSLLLKRVLRRPSPGIYLKGEAFAGAVPVDVDLDEALGQVVGTEKTGGGAA